MENIMKTHKYKFIKYLQFLFLGIFIFSCATSPTGRWQMILVSNDYVNEKGEEGYEMYKAKYPIDNGRLGYVRCVVNALLRQVDEEELEEAGIESWEITVFRGSEVNAFAFPGGKIGVFTGLLDKVTRTQDQLAFVMGHEIYHALSRHGHEKVSLGFFTIGFNLLFQIITGVNISGLSTLALNRPNSRSAESEADELGMDLMALAGFNPHGAIQAQENLAALSGGGTPEFLSTHPSSDTRIEDLKENLDYAMDLYGSQRNRPSCR